jgi:RNA polymerase-binding transcription factor DksA
MSRDVRERLTAERAKVQARLTALETAFRNLVEAGDGTNIDDEHDPEGATVAFERAQVAALIEQANASAADLDHALANLSENTYGTCEICSRPIAAGRLTARPSARTCITCAGKR